MPTRTLHHADALIWLSQLEAPLTGSSIVTSLPDISEFPKMSLSEWKTWFTSTVKLVFSRCPAEGMSIFYQSDIKKDGAWIDKAYLCQKAAEQSGDELIAHKIICRTPPGTAHFGRVGYSHLLCFSKKIRPRVAISSADVLPDAGPSTWKRGMGLDACRIACEFIKSHTPSHTILDPFCGHGTILAVANDFGFHAIGVDRTLKYIRKAETIQSSTLEIQST